MYSKFYFLNIPKTTGVSFDINIMQNLYKIMNRHGIDTSANLRFNDHNSWDNFDDQTYVFSIFRDPVDRTLAEFTNLRIFDAFGKRKSDSGVHVDDTLDLTLEDLDMWLTKFYTADFQTKTLFNGLNPPIHAIPEKIKRINLFIDDDQILSQHGLQMLCNRILSDLGIEETIHASYVPHVRFQQGYALDFAFDKVRGSALEHKIKAMNYLDCLIHENKSNFHRL
jgi:hypothetical protein